jgi:hypothetical protein
VRVFEKEGLFEAGEYMWDSGLVIIEHWLEPPSPAMCQVDVIIEHVAGVAIFLWILLLCCHFTNYLHRWSNLILMDHVV